MHFTIPVFGEGFTGARSKEVRSSRVYVMNKFGSKINNIKRHSIREVQENEIVKRG